MAETDEVQLGGNIRLSGFRDIDAGSMIVLKKMVGSYVRRYGEITTVEELSLVLKPIHKQEENAKYEIHGKLRAGSETFASDLTDKNMFVALDSVLKKIESMCTHQKS
jgi:ribosome-associated translation inhibitor RaiA